MEEKQKEAQELYAQLQMIEEHAKQLQQQGQAIESQQMDLKMTERSIDEFKSLKKGDEMMVPLSNGIFAKAELKNNEDLLINVGSQVIVKKSPDEAKELLKEQLNNIVDVKGKLQSEMEKLSDQGQKIQKKLQELMK
tara:strand:- start:7025 stop:7435 length:411 start_codon:yes stop_codon:yes gene_type:complete